MDRCVFPILETYLSSYRPITIILALIIGAILGSPGIFVAACLLAQFSDMYLRYRFQNANLLNDLVWEIECVQKARWETGPEGEPLLHIKIKEVRWSLPYRTENIQIPENSPWAKELTEGKQVRFMRKRSFGVLRPPWEKLYDIGPVWAKLRYTRTYLGNYSCGADHVPNSTAWTDSSCPGDTLEEAYQALARRVHPEKLPPLSEFQEELNAHILDPTDPFEMALIEAAKHTSPSSPEFGAAVMKALRQQKIEES